MESIPPADLLDLVKQILSSTPSVARSSEIPRVLPAHIPSLPATSTSLPTHPLPLARAIDRLTQDVLPYLNASSLSPRYYGFVTGGVTPAALVGDVLASIYDQNVCVHLPQESIATNVEVAALNMLVDLFQLPAGEWGVGTEGNGGGIFTTGATASNVLGLALGREYVLSEAARRVTGKAMSVGDFGILEAARAGEIEKVKVISTLPHSSIGKAAAAVGIGRENVVGIKKEGTVMEMDIEKLQELAESSEREKTAYILTVSAGEVNTGLFASGSAETMRRVRKICDRYGIWIHVDGAFGLFGRSLLGHNRAGDYQSIVDGVKGLEVADSITADGHKVLNVPYDCGIFFTRHKKLSEATFMNAGAAYLSSGPGASLIQTPLNIGLENSRRFRALPAFATLSAYGREGYCDMLMRQIDLARKISAWIGKHDKLELLPGDSNLETAVTRTFIIVLFRAKDEADNETLVQRIKSDGRIYASGTSWEGRPATRIAVSNWRVNVEADAKVVMEVLSDLTS